MNYIRITKDNIDKEHICCAMSGKNSIVKKEWLKQRFEEGLVFIGVQSAESVLLNISLLKMHGIQFLQMDICILIVYGLQVRLRGMVIHQIY